jgi:hypothetical protein
MTRPHRRWSAPMLAALLLFTATTATAQVDGVFGALLIEPELLPVPVLRFHRIGVDDQTWSLSVIGLTVGIEHQRPIRPKARLVTTAEITAARANGSDRIYERGELAESAGYENRLFDFRLGFDYERTDRWTTSMRIIALANRVGGLPAELEYYWNTPFAGASIEQSYERHTAGDPFRGTFAGVRGRARAETFIGAEVETWSRALLEGEHSHRIGNLRMSESATLFYSESLNLVNRFLVGSSWRVPGIHPLYGFRYAEFRLDKGVAVSGGADYRLTDRIDLGMRMSHLTGSADGLDVRAHGVALEVGTTMRGVGVTFGAGLPRQRDPVQSGPTFYAMVGTAVFVDLGRLAP